MGILTVFLGVLWSGRVFCDREKSKERRRCGFGDLGHFRELELCCEVR